MADHGLFQIYHAWQRMLLISFYPQNLIINCLAHCMLAYIAELTVVFSFIMLCGVNSAYIGMQCF